MYFKLSVLSNASQLSWAIKMFVQCAAFVHFGERPKEKIIHDTLFQFTHICLFSPKTQKKVQKQRHGKGKQQFLACSSHMFVFEGVFHELLFSSRIVFPPALFIPFTFFPFSNFSFSPCCAVRLPGLNFL